MGDLLGPNQGEDAARNLLADATTCAIAILTERARQLSREDREDLVELAGIVFASDDMQEVEAAGETMLEILAQRPSRVSPFSLTEEADPEQFTQWTAYVSHAVRQARKAADLTQDQLAEQTGIHQSHLSRIEKGQVSPTHKTLTKIADALQIDVSTLSSPESPTA